MKSMKILTISLVLLLGISMLAFAGGSSSSSSSTNVTTDMMALRVK